MATDITPEKNAEAESLGEINKYDFRTETEAVFKSQKGLNEEIVRQISGMKDEPEWMLEFRLKALEIFESKPMPEWGGDIDINFQDIYYYLKPTDGQEKSWDDVPEEIKHQRAEEIMEVQSQISFDLNLEIIQYYILLEMHILVI